MSRDAFLVGAGGVPSPQVEGQIGQTRSVRKIQLDEPHQSRNPMFRMAVRVLRRVSALSRSLLEVRMH